jgi:hypothetical protein
MIYKAGQRVEKESLSMRAVVILCLALTSCAYQATEMAQAIKPSEPKPAIRERIVPGTTFGNIVLQRETIDAIRDAIVSKIGSPDCSPTQLKVSDTWALGEPAPSEYSSAFLQWTELWTVDDCGKNVDVQVVYMLHSKTSVIDVSVSRLGEGQALVFN